MQVSRRLTIFTKAIDKIGDYYYENTRTKVILQFVDQFIPIEYYKIACLPYAIHFSQCLKFF